MKQGHFKVVGDAPFSVPTGDFMISPLTSDASLYILRLADEKPSEQKVADITSSEYTKVHGGIAGITYKIDTDDTFQVVYEYEQNKS